MVEKMVAVTHPKRSPAADWLRWIFLGAFFWTAVGLIFALPHLANVATRRDYLLSSLAAWWSWGLLAPLIIAVDMRLPFAGRRLTRWLLPQLICGPLLTVGYVYLDAAVRAA